MTSPAAFFVFCAICVPFGLFVWHILSSIGRLTRTVEDIALTLRRIEKGGGTLT